MTATDILFKTNKVLELINKTEITEDELKDLNNTVLQYDDMLQRLWFLMIDIGNTINSLKAKQAKEPNPLTEGFIKVLSNVRDQMALKFGEKDYFRK